MPRRQERSVFVICNVNSVFGFISQLSALHQCLVTDLEGISLIEQFAIKNRKELQVKMASVFLEETKGLPVELQEVLLDDMVTAFENRLIVFKRAISQDKNDNSSNIEVGLLDQQPEHYSPDYENTS